jgi:hypothetical protein
LLAVHQGRDGGLFETASQDFAFEELIEGVLDCFLIDIIQIFPKNERRMTTKLP